MLCPIHSFAVSFYIIDIYSVSIFSAVKPVYISTNSWDMPSFTIRWAASLPPCSLPSWYMSVKALSMAVPISSPKNLLKKMRSIKRLSVSDQHVLSYFWRSLFNHRPVLHNLIELLYVGIVENKVVEGINNNGSAFLGTGFTYHKASICSMVRPVISAISSRA